MDKQSKENVEDVSPTRGEWNVLINFESGLGWAAFRLVLFG